MSNLNEKKTRFYIKNRIIRKCIIRTFKSKYRRNMIKNCIKKIDECEELIMPDMKEAIFFIKDAWLNVSKETIANCWRKAGDYLVYIKIFII